MARNDIVHIAIAPPDMLEASIVKQVAAILNKDLYGTRLLLAGKIPRIVAHYQTTQLAEWLIWTTHPKLNRENPGNRLPR